MQGASGHQQRSQQEPSQVLHSYNSLTAVGPTIAADRFLRYIPKKQPEGQQVAIDIPNSIGPGNQDVEGGINCACSDVHVCMFI